MEEAIKKIEEVIDYYEDRLEHTTLPEDEKEEIMLWSNVYKLRRAIEVLKVFADDSMG